MIVLTTDTIYQNYTIDTGGNNSELNNRQFRIMKDTQGLTILSYRTETET